MELANFRTKEEEESLITLYSSFNPHPDAWIGYTDEGHEGNWTNVAGDETKISLDFHRNEPNNSGDENCLLFEQWSDFRFNDRSCSHKSQFICQNTLVSDVPQNLTISLRSEYSTTVRPKNKLKRGHRTSPSLKSYTASNLKTTATPTVKNTFNKIGQYGKWKKHSEFLLN